MAKLTFWSSRALWRILMVFACCLEANLMAGLARAEPLLQLNPINPVSSIGQGLEVDIQLDSITGVYGGQMDLSVDPAIVQVNGGKLTPGICPGPDFVQSNSADNTTGNIVYTVTQLNPTLPCNGGKAATISFECISGGVSPVSFASSIIADRDGTAISHLFQNGTVECHAQDSAGGRIFWDTNGNGVQDPGEPDLAGVDVEVTDSQGGVQTVTTDANGYYSATVPPGLTILDVDNTTLPAGSVQTAGTDPTEVNVPVGGFARDVDGYRTMPMVGGSPAVGANQIPTLGGWGLLLLALCLGFGGIRRLHNRR